VEHLLNSLNEAQRHAVEETQGPVMILAGPGSGKTRVLTHRIAWLIANGVDPFRILSLTFTNKAAAEMKERITALIGKDAKDVWMGTFHSVFARILRIEAQRLGYSSNFTIYDTDDSKSIIRQILKENNIDDKTYAVSMVLHRISGAKMSLINPEEYNNNTDIQSDDHKANKPLLGHIYQLYWNRCRRSNAMDFDDLLYNMNLLLRDFQDVKEKYQNKFHYVLVDEYQDTCFSQYVILKKLASVHQNICVVGDDAQGIYAFRGARIENILNFNRDFPKTQMIKLEQNYRSSKVIVDAANSIISNNTSQLEKTIWTQNNEGDKIKVLHNMSETEEAIQIAQEIFHTKMNNQCNNVDFAILYRTNAQSRALEEALRKMNIPYRVYGSVSFYKRKEIKDVMAYFRLTVNLHDEEAITRIINVPIRGIGKTTIDRIVIYAHEKTSSFWEIISGIHEYYDKVGLNKGVAKKIEDFCIMIKRFRTQIDNTNAFDLATSILNDTGYLQFLKNSDEPEAATRLENVEELMNGIKSFCEEAIKENPEKQVTLSDFLLEVSLLTDLDDDTEQQDKVSLMTIHSAKGLEFPYVYIAGLEEQMFPSSMSMNSRSELEEERRLFYVAVTRAMKRVTLSYADSRFRWGKREFFEPSRFIEEIDEKLLDTPRQKEQIDWGRERQEYFDSKEVAQPQLRFKPDFNKKPKAQPQTPQQTVPKGFKKLPKQESLKPAATNHQIEDVMPGMQVEHLTFGKGKVLQVDGSGTNKKAVVFFPAVGKKNLLLKFAKITIIG
jgi:DNA helicase II / ATP-dependent DNA helicase PcrA